jgi:hypothetical protein
MLKSVCVGETVSRIQVFVWGSNFKMEGNMLQVRKDPAAQKLQELIPKVKNKW